MLGEVVKISNGVEDEGGPAAAIKFMHLPNPARPPPSPSARFRFSIRFTESRQNKIASRNGMLRKFVIDSELNSSELLSKEQNLNLKKYISRNTEE